MAITMNELAKLAGVSRPAVSAVLNNSHASRVSPETREKILRLAAETNFVPNLAARQMKGISSRLVGLISVPSHMGLVAVLQAELITMLQTRGFEVLTAHWAAAGDQERIMNEFRARQVNGVMALGMRTKIIQTENAPMPIVYCSHTNLCGFDVGCDIALGGYLAARHLLAHGRRKLVYLGVDASVFNQRKHAGMLKALEEAGLEAGEDSLLIVENGDMKEILSQLRRRRADALVCCNDFTAAAMLKFFPRSGVDVPGDLAVTGFDGYSFCEYTPVTLATVVQPVRAQAERAVALLVERINAGQAPEGFSSIKLPPVFRPGASCGCPEPEKNTIPVDAFILRPGTDIENEGLEHHAN